MVAAGTGRRTQEQRSAQMRTRLLDATIDCLVEYGYAGTTTPRVAEMAGVTRGAQVHHFGSKNDLVLAAIRHLAARRIEQGLDRARLVTAADDPVGAVLDLLWDLHEGPMFIATVELWVAGRTDPALAGEMAAVESTVVGALVAAVGHAVPPEAQRSMIDFLYTAMDALRGILISSFIDADHERARRRWDRAVANLRRVADVDLRADR